MAVDLHLILELDSWVPAEGPTEPLIKLETYLAAHGNVTLTLVSGQPLRPCLERLATAGDWSFPEHFIAEGGLALYHARENGSWTEDTAYRHWVATRWDPLVLERTVASRGSRRFRQVLGAGSPRVALFTVDPDQSLKEAVAELEACLALIPFPARIVVAGDTLEVVPMGVGVKAAALFLHQHLPQPCALVVCGRSEASLDLFQIADYPVLLAGGPLRFNSPGLPKDKVFFSPEAGPRGVLDALLGLDPAGSAVAWAGPRAK